MANEETMKKLYPIFKRIVDIEDEYPGSIHPEFFDWLDIVVNGLKKYKLNSWLDIEAPACTHKHNHDSMFHHLSESFIVKPTGNRYIWQMPEDKESGKHPLLHLACRSVFGYVRDKKGITVQEVKK